MITRYRFEELVTELTNIQQHVSWGMTCVDHRVSYMYSEQMTIDSDPLRSVDEMINSKYASCLEFGILMKHFAIKYGLPCKQVILPRDTWVIHGMVIIGTHAISMGNYIEVLEKKRMTRRIIELDFNVGESRRNVYERMLAKL